MKENIGCPKLTHFASLGNEHYEVLNLSTQISLEIEVWDNV